MQANISLANLDFGGKQIQIYGTQIDPMIKCSDLLIHVLGYKKCNDASWFRVMVNNPKLTVELQWGNSPTRFFTEKGIYVALMKSNKPAAEKFQDMVCDLLKQIRLQTHNQLAASQQALEETQKQLEAATVKFESCKKVGYIYGLKHKRYGTIDYVGFTENTIQQRLDSHISGLLTSIKIPFYKCLIAQAFQNYEAVTLETVEYYQEQEIRDRETYHQLGQNSIQCAEKLICKKCTKTYKQFKSFENHREKCYN